MKMLNEKVNCIAICVLVKKKRKEWIMDVINEEQDPYFVIVKHFNQLTWGAADTK